MFNKQEATQQALNQCGFCSPMLLHIDYGNGAPSFYLIERGIPTPISREKFVELYNSTPTLTIAPDSWEFAWR